MPKKSKTKANINISKVIDLFLLAVIGLFLFSIYSFNTSANFKIEALELRFDKFDGKTEDSLYTFKKEVSIFRKDLYDKLHKYAESLCPYAKSIIIQKKFPSKILISIVERKPYFLVKTSSGTITVDKDFTILPYMKANIRKNKKLLTVIGVEEKSYNIKAGHKINSSKLKAAKEVFELFNRTSVSKKLPLASINVSRTRCISAILSNGTELILDESSLENSLDGLHKIFSELRKNRIKPTYIDLRFKEPIIGTG